MKRYFDTMAILGALAAGGFAVNLGPTCAYAGAGVAARAAAQEMKSAVEPNAVNLPGEDANPLLGRWDTPFGMPPFDRIKEDHYLPVYREAIARTRGEVEEIVQSAEPATFANTVEALDGVSELLDRVEGVFQNLRSAETNDRLQEIARQVAPLTSALADDILLNDRLFGRVKAVWQERATLPLDAEQRKLVEETYKDFVRGGANLAPDGKTRLRAINEELAVLTLQFGDNVLKETNDYRLVIDRKEDLAGLPGTVVRAAAEAARQGGLEGKWVFTLQAPSIWPFLSYAENRDLRRQVFTAYIQRGDHGNRQDNKATLVRIAALRAERAKLLGYADHASFVLEERMAKKPEQVYRLLDQLWKPALAVARKEAADLQAMVRQEGHDFQLQPWDWWYYTEKMRQARYDLDENELRAYFPLDAVRQGAFEVAHRLYGLTFTERTDLPKYHPEVRTYEVKDADGSHLGVFMVDFHPRPGKRGGAWSSGYRRQHFRDGQDLRPIVVNVCNFTRPAGDTAALLRLEEVETLFHEFGHGLHSLLSRIHYKSLGSVPRDFVELPSQIMENWALEPQVLKLYAKHWQTGAPIPDALVAKIKAAQRFNQGFATVEYLAASFLDLRWHTLADAENLDADAFEKAALDGIGLIPQIVSRYRSTYFQHIFAGGYSAGYYSYIWSEVLDADAFEAFKEKGLFDPATARSFRVNILEKGGTAEAMDMYRAFRGREPVVRPLLERRGLTASAADLQVE
jgi:peptidyl-dipeptidase Dcp